MSACKCCERYAPGPVNGDERPPCQGVKDIKQARDLAKLWCQRAMEAGWEKQKTKCGCGTVIPSNRSECDACFECRDPDLWRCEGCRATFPLDELNDENRCAKCREVNHRTVPATPPTRGQPGDKEHRAGECRGQAWFACRTCNPRGSKQYLHCKNGCAVPCTPDSDVCLPCKDKAEARKGHPGQEKLVAEHLEAAIAAGREIAYCQGKERHHCVVGSKLHEQMLERGCIQCGAYPEDPT